MTLARSTGMFAPDELGWLKSQIEQFVAGAAAQGGRWVVDPQGDDIVGAAHYAPDGTYEPAHFADDDTVWNLYFLGTSPAVRGQGRGRRLLEHAEGQARARGGRRLIIETSSMPAFEPARTLYAAHGYTEYIRVDDAYGPGDDKIVLIKRLTDASPGR